MMSEKACPKFIVHRSSFIVFMLIDTHAHLDQEEFDADRAEVIARAIAAGVESIIAIGVTAQSSAAAVRLAEGEARGGERASVPSM